MISEWSEINGGLAGLSFQLVFFFFLMWKVEYWLEIFNIFNLSHLIGAYGDNLEQRFD